MDTKKKARRRWPWWLLLAAVLLLAGGGFAASRFLNAENVRDLIADQLAQAAGLPASVERVEITWFPLPGLTAYGVRAGDSEMEARAAAVTAYIRWLPLLLGRVEIGVVELDDFGLTLPEDWGRIMTVWNSVSQALGGGGEASGVGIQVSVDRVEADQLHATRLGRVAAEGSFALDGLDEDVFTLSAALRAPLIGPQATADVALEFDTALEMTGIGGEVALRGLSSEVPAPVRADLSGAFSGDVSEIAVAITGDLELPGEGQLAGPVSAKAWWRDDKLILNDFQWQAPGVEAVCDVTWAPGEAIALEIARAALPSGGIAALLARVAPSGVRVAPQEDARFTAKDVLLGITLDGGFTPYTGEATFYGIDFLGAEENVLLDNIEGRVHLAENSVHIDALNADGLSVTGTVTPDAAAGTFAVDIHGTADLAAADPSPWLPFDGLRLDAGQAQIDTLKGTFGGDGGMPDDLAIAITLDGVAGAMAPSPGADPVPITGLSGGVRNQGAGWVLDDLRAEGVRVSGALNPAEGSEGWAMNLSGGADLSSPLLRLALPADVLSDPAGSVAFTRLSGSITPDGGMPRNLVVEGTIANGRAKIAAGGLNDTISDLNATFSTTEGVVNADAKLASERFGAVSWKGRYTSGDGSLSGALGANLAGIAGPFLPDAAQSWATGALRSYGSGPFDVRLTPGDDGKSMRLNIARTTAPTLDATLALRATDTGWSPASLEANATVAVDRLGSALPEGIRGSGTADVSLNYGAADQRVNLSARLDDATLRVGEHLSKGAGQAASVQVAASAGALQRVQVAVLGERIELQANEKGLAAEAFRLDLGNLRGLLTDGAVASGTVSGSFQTMPINADLALDDVAFALAPGLGVDALNGGVRFRNGLVEVENLRIRGANSDCVLTAESQGESWRGALNGAKLDLNAVLAMVDTFSAFTGGSGGGAPGDAKDEGARVYAGTLNVDLGEVHYRNGIMRDLRTQVSVLPSAITLGDLRFVPASGSAAGTLTLRSATDEQPTRVEIALALAGADLAELDRLVFPQPRELAGVIDGDLSLSFPLDDAPLNGIHGHFNYTASNGTYGKFGIATKLLGLLRTTELIRLRLPSIRDKGLNFDTSTARFRFENGIMHWDEMEVVAKSHSFAASGHIDFPKNQTDIVVRMHLLEAVTGSILGQLPVIKQTVNVIKKATPMRVRITGPPITPDAVEDTSEEPTEELELEIPDTAEQALESEEAAVLPVPDTAEDVFEVDAVDPPAE